MARYKVEISGKTAVKEQPFFPLRGTRRITVVIVVMVLIGVGFYLTPKLASSASLGLNLSGSPVANMLGQPGATVYGSQCGPGIRQVSWSHYSPICEPKFTGNNGGATSNGVTSTTITITYRAAASADLQIAYSLIPPALIGTNEEAISTMQAYINVFNKYFELYGRKVKLVAYNGTSDFLQEDLTGNNAKAQADAINVANNIHAFADLSMIDSTSIYDQYLADNKVVAFNLGFLPNSYYQTYSPYVYSPYPSCDTSAQADAAVIGKAIANQPAMYAGDARFIHETAKLGIIFPQGSSTQECADNMLTLLKSKYNVVPAVVKEVALDFNTLTQQEESILAQFKENGVNTVVCAACDPVTPKLFTSFADQNHFYPQWYAEATGAPTGGIDAFLQGMDQKEMDHTIIVSRPTPPKQDIEAYNVYKMGATSTTQLEPVYPLIYANMLMLFDALQAAGPDLNPQTFKEGLDSLPTSLPGGEFGKWDFSQGTFSPAASFQIDYYAANTISEVNGKPGAIEPCNGGKEYSFNFAPTLPVGQPLNCFQNANK